MRAAVYRGINQVQIENVEVPALLHGEVLLRVHACGVCGTDLKKIHFGLVPPPRIFGHETAGVLVAVGKGVDTWRLGERVLVNHHVPCLREDCFYCQRRVFAQCPVYKRTGATAGFEPSGGGFAEYVRVMDWCVDGGMERIPDGVSFEEASFVEPLNTCLKGVELADIRQGDTVFVIGQGPIGLLFTQLAKLAGASVVVTDRFAYRRELAVELGADFAFDPDDVQLSPTTQGLSKGRGADVAIVAVPSTAVVPQAFEAIRPGGKVLLFAQTRMNDLMQVDAGAICMQEKSLIGSYSSDILLQKRASELIFTRQVRVRELISHRFPLESIQEAIEYASHPRDNSLKIMVNP